ncbi:hypothetical protein O4H49_20400 [Kiloniella laminariae]|uniref:Uncharacterized protein n=1 Tax=Kiloniella laminariae TaxID=454162 RepID=A0ABT4LPX7_9PROT|nr:hypothetical protein [Kiloniella laminariae]MCZ4283151.1 hypothetical protein [Kiloniella laminariae]
MCRPQRSHPGVANGLNIGAIRAQFIGRGFIDHVTALGNQSNIVTCADGSAAVDNVFFCGKIKIIFRSQITAVADRSFTRGQVQICRGNNRPFGQELAAAVLRKVEARDQNVLSFEDFRDIPNDITGQGRYLVFRERDAVGTIVIAAALNTVNSSATIKLMK